MTLPVSVPNVPTWQLCRVRWYLGDFLGDDLNCSARITSKVKTVSVASTRPGHQEETLVATWPTVSVLAGYLSGPDGDPYADLNASGDPDLNPTGWPVTVEVDVPAGNGRAAQTLSVSYPLPPGGDVDLAPLLALAPTVPGATIVEGEQGVSVTSMQITASGNTATYTTTFSDGSTSTGTFPLPAGTGGGGAATTDAADLIEGTLDDARLSTAVITSLARADDSVQTVNGEAPDGSGDVVLTIPPSTPGEDSVGTAALQDDVVTEPKLAAAVRTKLNATSGGASPNVLVLGTDDPVPPGTPANTLIVRDSGGPTNGGGSAVLEVIAASTTEFASTSSFTATLDRPAGVQLGDYLIAAVSCSFTSPAGKDYAFPSGWERIEQLHEGNARSTAWFGYKVTDVPAVPAQSTFTNADNNAGRMVGVCFRVTGVDLAAPIAGRSAYGASGAVPAFAVSGSTTLTLLEGHSQVTGSNTGQPTSATGMTRVRDVFSGPNTTKTLLSVWSKNPGGTPNEVATTWSDTDGSSPAASSIALKGLQ